MFDPLSWIIGYSLNKVIDTSIKKHFTKIQPSLKNEIQKWSKELPDDYYVNPEALFPKDDEIDSTFRPALDSLKSVLGNDRVPTELQWYEALIEQWKHRKVLLGEDAQPFFTHPIENIIPYINALSKNLYMVCAKNQDSFSLQTLDHLNKLIKAQTATTSLITKGEGSPNFSSLEAKIPGLRFFTKSNIEFVSYFSSLFLRNRSYGTITTPYLIKDDELIHRVHANLTHNNFTLLYGNSGRGKTFFLFQFMPTEINNFDLIIYFSPQLSFGDDINYILITEIIEAIDNGGYTTLFILDDSHLANEEFKRELLYRFKLTRQLAVMFASRHRESLVIPDEYLIDEHIVNFNKVAESYFLRILNKFGVHNQIEISPVIEDALIKATSGGNLVFLTVMLQSWEELLLQPDYFQFDIDNIKANAYSRFCEFYDQHSEEWKYINHIVSALFQYEIRIDKRYLSTENQELMNKGLEEYLKDRLIHGRIIPEEKYRKYFVFMDFAHGEERDMMQHASEFRFYLEANNDNLRLDHLNYLDSLEFTKLVLQKYILFKPNNIQEVIKRITSNASDNEQKDIISYLWDNVYLKQIMRESMKDILKDSLHSDDRDR